MSENTKDLPDERRSEKFDLEPPSFRTGLPDPVLRALGLGVGFLLWELSARLIDLSWFPPPIRIFSRLFELIAQGRILPNLQESLLNLGYGLGISIVIGLCVGVLMGLSKYVNAALEPYVDALLTAPSLVFAPIFFSLFGLGRSAIVGLIVMYSVFILIINTANALQRPSVALLEMADSMCASRWSMVRWVIIPGAVPMIMSGVRIASGRAVKGMINGEMFIAIVGLGHLVQSAGRRFDATTVLAILFMIVVIAMIIGRIVDRLDRRFTQWIID